MPEVQTETPAPMPVQVVEEAKPTIEQTMAATFDKMNPEDRVTRADDGKFQSKEPIKAEGAETGDTATNTDQTPAVAAKEPEKPAIPRPQSWSADVDELWGKLSPDAQEFVAKREGEAHKRLSELGEIAKSAEKYEAIVEKFKPVINGNDPTSEIENLFATKAALLRDPVGSLQWLAQQLNVDLSKLGQPQQQIDPSADPQIAALTQQVMALQRQLSETSHKMTAREQAETQAREQTLTDSIDKFAEGKDYWGEIEDEVYNQILALKTANPAKVLADPMATLKEAHDRAVKLTESVQAKLDKEAKAKEEEAKKAEAKKKADEAKKLASLNVKSTTGSSPKAAHKTIEAEMAEIYERMSVAG